jgi:hypothetical protein
MSQHTGEPIVQLSDLGKRFGKKDVLTGLESSVCG